MRDPGLPEHVKARLRSVEEGKTMEAIDAGIGDLARSCSPLVGPDSHGVSALRELVCRPRRVLRAGHRSQGRFVTAVFDHGDFVREFVAGVDRLPRYDTFVEPSRSGRAAQGRSSDGRRWRRPLSLHRGPWPLDVGWQQQSFAEVRSRAGHAREAVGIARQTRTLRTTG